MKVAVIIPCYNVAEHVESAVRSVLAQEHIDLDIVAVDDGSTDATGSILERMVGESNGRLRVVLQNQQGASAARNAGLRASTGEYVQFLDADDVLFPKKIAVQLSIIPPGDLPAMIAGSYRNRMEDGSTKDVVCSSDDPWNALISGRLGTTSSNLWLRTTLENGLEWNEDQISSQDHELAFRILRAGGKVVFDPSIHTEVLKRSEGSISQSDPNGNWVRYIVLRSSIRNCLQEENATFHASRIDLVDQFIFGAIRIVARSDRSLAEALFEQYLDRNFEPRPLGGVSERYVRLYRLLGFVRSERIVAIMDTLQRIIGKL